MGNGIVSNELSISAEFWNSEQLLCRFDFVLYWALRFYIAVLSLYSVFLLKLAIGNLAHLAQTDFEHLTSIFLGHLDWGQGPRMP